MATSKKPAVNQFGCPIGVAWNAKNLRERIRILEEGIDGGKWRGEKLDLAKYHLRQYRAHLAAYLRDLAAEKKATRRKKAKTAKRAA